MYYLWKVDVMNHQESLLVSTYGWSKHDLRKVRGEIQQFEGHPLWFREDSKKPKHLQTIWWTPVGLIYLQEYFKSVEIMKQPDPEALESVMTKAQFDKLVDNTKWVGRITRNNYKNTKVILVEHHTGFRVIVNCRDNKHYPKNSYVSVDTKNNRHMVRKPSFKTYEKAQQA
jgi:uncharacterized short protein YbdD (DUF466 family)